MAEERSACSCAPTLFIWITLSARQWWWRRRRRQQYRLCMIYTQYWIWRSGHCTNNVNNAPNQQIQTQWETLTHVRIWSHPLRYPAVYNVYIRLAKQFNAFIHFPKTSTKNAAIPSRHRKESINNSNFHHSNVHISAKKWSYQEKHAQTIDTKHAPRISMFCFFDSVWNFQFVFWCFKMYVVFGAQYDCSMLKGKQNKYPECDVLHCLDTSTIQHQHSIQATYIHSHKRKSYSERAHKHTIPQPA